MRRLLDRFRRQVSPDSSGTGEEPAPGEGRRFPLWWILVALLLLWGWQAAFDSLTVTTISYSAFKRHIAAGEVARLVIQPEQIEGQLHAGVAPRAPTTEEAAAVDDGSGEPKTGALFRVIRVEDPKLVEQLEAAEVEFLGQRPRLIGRVLVAWVLPLVIMLGLWMLITRRVRGLSGQALSFGQSRARLVPATKTGVNFDDVAGCDEAKQELEEIVAFLKEPTQYERLGARIPKGTLLVGPPGTGKTLLARAVAGEAEVPFYSISGSDFVEMFVGVGAARVRDLFEQAVRRAPCIVFIDELDAIGRQRGVHMGAVNDEREQTLNQLLIEMDGFEPNNGVILLAATNRPDVLDRALLRPGRFDRQVVLDAPDLDGRLAILEVHARNKPLARDVDLRAIAQGTPGFAGADLANVENEAALLAARRGGDVITQRDLLDAVEKVIAGPERRSRRLTDENRSRVACHETGHALVAYFTPGSDPVRKISIVPRGRAALGYTLQVPEEDQLLQTESELRGRIRGLLGGRAAEEVVFGEVSSGAENDLEKATALARHMVAMLGMNKNVGLAHCAQREGIPRIDGTGVVFQRDCSHETADSIDAEVRALLDEEYTQAKTILTGHRAALDRVRASLFERETLDAGAFAELVRSVSA